MSIRQKFSQIVSAGRQSQNCHGGRLEINSTGLRCIGIVGTPNVGKSVIFNCLTGAYATVSNYPGTSVNVSKGKTRIEGEEFEVMDTPGMYSLMPITEEERVARTMLFNNRPVVILHVVDARNLERMLPLTIQLVEAGLPVMLAANMMDEAEAAGMEINCDRLEKQLAIPVVGTAATKGRGIETLRKRIIEYAGNRQTVEI